MISAWWRTGTATPSSTSDARQRPASTLHHSRRIRSAAQICCMRESAGRPSRVTRSDTATLSAESRLTAERRGTGSSPGSSTTSLASPRIVVVDGATSVRLSRGIAASRDRTTTGRRPICSISHHHSSPRGRRPRRLGAGRVELRGPRRPLRQAAQICGTPPGT